MIIVLTNTLSTVESLINNTNLIFDNYQMSLDLLKHCSICIPQRITIWPEEAPLTAMDCNIKLLSDDYSHPNLSLINKKSSTI